MFSQSPTLIVLPLLLWGCGNLESTCAKGYRYEAGTCVPDDTGASVDDTDTDTDTDTDDDPVGDADGDGYPTATDCDDHDPDIHPGATERCDGEDNDCDGTTDEDDAIDADTWYLDYDQDGYGAPDRTRTACDAPNGYVSNDQDCNDQVTGIHPGARETCDLRDEDCDGDIDDNAIDADTWYRDQDGDGYGRTADWQDACQQPAGYVAADGDCQDGDARIYPRADEFCDGLDNDCDGDVDEDAADGERWYRDLDGDGYGDASVHLDDCDAPTNFVANAGDCDDGDSSIHPGAPDDDGDGVDNDCDGSVDEDYVCTYTTVDLYDTSSPLPRAFDPYYFTVAFVGAVEGLSIYDWEMAGSADTAWLGFEFFDSGGTSICTVYYDASDHAHVSGWTTSSGGTLYDSWLFSLRDGYSGCGTLSTSLWGSTDIRDLIESWTWGLGFGDLRDTATSLAAAVSAGGGNWSRDWAPYVIGGYVYSNLFGQAYEVNYARGYEAECGDVTLSGGSLVDIPAPTASPLDTGVWEHSALLYYFYAISLVP